MVIVLVAIISATAGATLWQTLQPRQKAPALALITLPQPRAISDFALLDHHSNAFTRSNLTGRWTLVFFGFTHCPDVCPGTLLKLQQVNHDLMKTLPDGTDPPAILFISVDPERDTPEKLQAYIGYFDPAFVAVTGDHSQLQPLARQMGIAYHIEEHKAEDQAYGVDHSTGILLINPDAELHGVFPSPQDAAQMTADLLITVNGGRET
jgi:protein SCO1/2